MPILNVQVDTTGQAGLLPKFIYIETNDTVTEVTATGYLNKLVSQNIPLSESNMALVSTRATPNATSVQVSLFDVAKSGDNWSLVPNSSQLSLSNGQIFVGNASGIATGVAVTGDISITNGGVVSITAGAIVNADVNASAEIAFSKLAALTSGQILVGSAGNVPTAVAMSGDATIIASGALTVAANAITTAKILDANVTLAKLASGITPSHIVKFASQVTTVGGAAAEAITVTGAAATDLAFVQIVNNGTANVTVVDAVVTLDTLTVTFSADPGNDTVINYQLLRAAA
jgi:hypothetical protein